MYGDIICRSPTSTGESLIYSSTTAIFNCVQIAFFPSASLFCGLLSKCAVMRLFIIPAVRMYNFLDAPSKHRLSNADHVVRCDRVTSMLTMSPCPPRATIHPPPFLPCRPQSDAAWSSSPPAVWHMASGFHCEPDSSQRLAAHTPSGAPMLQDTGCGNNVTRVLPPCLPKSGFADCLFEGKEASDKHPVLKRCLGFVAERGDELPLRQWGETEEC